MSNSEPCVSGVPELYDVYFCVWRCVCDWGCCFWGSAGVCRLFCWGLLSVSDVKDVFAAILQAGRYTRITLIASNGSAAVKGPDVVVMCNDHHCVRRFSATFIL